MDLNSVRDFVISLVSDAGKTLQEYYKSGNYSQKSKGGVDFLTQADEEVDAFLLSSLKAKYPETSFLTEETAPEDYSPLKNVDNLWIIDPLDGTTNFSRQSPNFAISVALVDKGKSKLGVVYLPITEDIYWAQQDRNEAIHNDKPMNVSSTNELGKVVIACDWPWKLDKRLDVVSWIKNICADVRQVKAMGSAVSDLASLADGKIDAYMHSGLKPWDAAASSLIIEKSGGRITTPTGSDWDVFESEIFASNNILHDQLVKLINKE